jgi:hypothetical protein
MCAFSEENCRLLLNLHVHCQTLYACILCQNKTMYPRTLVSVPSSKLCFHVTCIFLKSSLSFEI